jgi:hypothetical protein
VREVDARRRFARERAACRKSNYSGCLVLARSSPSAASRLDAENAPRVCGIHDPVLTLELWHRETRTRLEPTSPPQFESLKRDGTSAAPGKFQT